MAEVCEVEQIAVYAQVDAVEPTSRVLDSLRRGEIDAVTLTSSNIARALIGQLDARRGPGWNQAKWPWSASVP